MLLRRAALEACSTAAPRPSPPRRGPRSPPNPGIGGGNWSSGASWLKISSNPLAERPPFSSGRRRRVLASRGLTPPAEQFVERQPQAIDIAPRIRFRAQALGGHILQRADNVAGARHALQLAGELGQAKVGDPRRAALVDDQVGRLHVAVKDALAMSAV